LRASCALRDLRPPHMRCVSLAQASSPKLSAAVNTSLWADMFGQLFSHCLSWKVLLIGSYIYFLKKFSARGQTVDPLFFSPSSISAADYVEKFVLKPEATVSHIWNSAQSFLTLFRVHCSRWRAICHLDIECIAPQVRVYFALHFTVHHAFPFQVFGYNPQVARQYRIIGLCLDESHWI